MKKGIVLLLPILCVSAAAIYFLLVMQGSPKEAKARIFRVSIAIAADSHYYKGLVMMNDLLRTRSNGMLGLEIHHSAELGSERKAVDDVAQGTLDMTLSTTAPLANLTSAFMIFDLPFIIRDKARAYTWMDGPEGHHILDSLRPHGIVGLAIWESGFRHLTNSVRPIVRPEDLRGLTIRTMENPVHQATFRTLGARSVPMPFGGLYDTLQHKTVDGQENPLVIIETSRFFEVQSQLSLTGHFYAPGVLMINQALWDSLTTDQRMIIMKAAADARDWERRYCAEEDKRLLETLQYRGMNITRPDTAIWEQAVAPIYAEFEQTIGKEEIRSLIEAQK